MKLPFAVLLAGLSLLSLGIAAAKTITVDNKPGSVAQYTSVQAACDAADPGDTILIAGSPVSYNGALVRKQLNLVGAGYFLAENNIPGVDKSGVVLGIAFERTELSSPGNSSLVGLTLVGLGIPANVPGIMVDRCCFLPNSTPQQNLLGPFAMRRCYVTSSTLWVPQGASIRNSVVNQLVLGTGSTADRCILREGLSSAPGSSISNSIFLRTTSITAAAFAANAQGSVTHSLAVGGIGIGGNPTFLPSGGGNVATIAFNAETFVPGGLNDKTWLLLAGSPASSVASDGGDIGIFGGTLPYILSGVPSVPRVTRFQVPATATSASGLQIEMDAQSF